MGDPGGLKAITRVPEKERQESLGQKDWKARSWKRQVNSFTQEAFEKVGSPANALILAL